MIAGLASSRHKVALVTASAMPSVTRAAAFGLGSTAHRLQSQDLVTTSLTGLLSYAPVLDLLANGLAFLAV